MNSAICTLFEGSYHYGVATLVNSLYNNDFRGTIYVGYRGELPNWVKYDKSSSYPVKEIELNPAVGLVLKFVYLDTTNHFTNYKPTFMKHLIETYDDIENLFYFDPDIVVNTDFSFYLEWINAGIAVCEDINSPIQEFHPRRMGWRIFFKKHNIDLIFKNPIYVNGGFIGIKRDQVDFLDVWIKTQDIATELVGGLQVSFLDKIKIMMFDVFDQDCLNASIEAYNGTYSFIGKEGMGFSIGGYVTMFHAIGSPKPWKTNHLLRSLYGRTPRSVDVAYWKNTLSPILAHSKGKIRKEQLAIKIGKFIGRFYKV
jgi:hypothetical protein